jgi:DNA-binding transcriptional regulator YhcF (GntR family)
MRGPRDWPNSLWRAGMNEESFRSEEAAMPENGKVRPPWRHEKCHEVFISWCHAASIAFMPNPPDLAALLESPLARDRDAGPMQRQLHERLKRAILDGRLAPGSRLPGSRALAEALAISRNTVTAAYEHLAAEGYVQPDRQGTRVTELSSPALPRRAGKSAGTPATARRLAAIKPGTPFTEPDAALRPGVPALSHFPIGRLAARARPRHPHREPGHARLRQPAGRAPASRGHRAAPGDCARRAVRAAAGRHRRGRAGGHLAVRAAAVEPRRNGLDRRPGLPRREVGHARGRHAHGAHPRRCRKASTRARKTGASTRRA